MLAAIALARCTQPADRLGVGSMHRFIVLLALAPVTLAGCNDSKRNDEADVAETVDTTGDDTGVDTALPGDDGAGDDGAGDDGAGDDGAGDDGAGDDGAGDDGAGDDGSGDDGSGDDGSGDDGSGDDGSGDDGSGDDGSGDDGSGDDGSGDDGSGDDGGDGGSGDDGGDGGDGGDDTGGSWSPEICDGLDNDGDRRVDEGFDSDKDGTADCFDPEVCDGVDNDGDGLVDEDDALDPSTWYEDSDGDGYGVDGSTTTACNEPEGYTEDGEDCDDARADVHPDATEDCDAVDNDCDTTVDETCDDPCWDKTPCLTWYQANALGYLDVATSDDNTSVQFTNVGLDQDICFDRAIYTSDTTQAFYVDQALVDDDVRIAPGETVNAYYASYTTANGERETYLDAYAWWCVELGQATSRSETYDYYGEFPPSGFLEFSDVDNDVDSDGKEDHVDWAGGSGIQSQYSIWDYQADSTVLTAGKHAALGDDGTVHVTTLSRNLGAFDGTGTLTDTIPAGWAVSDMSVTPDTTTTNSDGTVTYTWAIAVDGYTSPTTSGGTVVIDTWAVTYSLARSIPVDKVELELPAATVDYFDMATDRTSSSLEAAVFDYDYDGDGAITCESAE
jgi:hypothetical protein